MAEASKLLSRLPRGSLTADELLKALLPDRTLRMGQQEVAWTIDLMTHAMTHQ